MPRHVGASLKAHGISNTLRSLGFERAVRIDPKNRKDQRKTAGYIADQVSDTTLDLRYHLGHKHGITRIAERVKTIDERLTAYQEALGSRFLVTRLGEGEDAYLIIRDKPNPVVADTLRQAADRFFKGGNDVAAETLRRWADLADTGQDW